MFTLLVMVQEPLTCVQKQFTPITMLVSQSNHLMLEFMS